MKSTPATDFSMARRPYDRLIRPESERELLKLRAARLMEKLRDKRQAQHDPAPMINFTEADAE